MQDVLSTQTDLRKRPAIISNVFWVAHCRQTNWGRFEVRKPCEVLSFDVAH